MTFKLPHLGALGVALVVGLAACNSSPSANAAERVVRSIHQGGMTRDYILHIPENLGRKDKWPVIIAVHPSFATGDDFERISKLDKAKDADEFVIAYPTGYVRSWNWGPCCGKANQANLDDNGFLRAVLADIKTVAPVEDRAYFVGFSNGAMMAYDMLCEDSDIVAGLAVTGATIPMNARTCNPSHPVPVFHFHGEFDPFSPYNGGMSAFERAGEIASVPEGISFLAGKNSCTADKTVKLTKDVSCVVHTGCAGGAEVELCKVPDMGHYWPGTRKTLFSAAMDLGPARPDLEISDKVIQFFLDHGAS